MKQIIEGTFSILSVLFNKLPFSKALSGYRFVLGCLGLAAVFVLSKKGILTDPAVVSTLEGVLLSYAGLALNAKGRPVD